MNVVPARRQSIITADRSLFNNSPKCNGFTPLLSFSKERVVHLKACSVLEYECLGKHRLVKNLRAKEH